MPEWQKVNPEVKAVYVTLAPYQITLVDPEDPLSYDVEGFEERSTANDTDDCKGRRLIQLIAVFKFYDFDGC